MPAEVALGLALIALVVAWGAGRRAKALATRVARLEALLGNESDRVAKASTALAQQAAPQDAAPPAAPSVSQPDSSWAPKPRGPSALVGLTTWLKANWIYPVAGVALVMAAIYLVQYSIDRGLLSPALRVALAITLGVALIAAAEYLRRRWGETGAPLVSATLAGAGIVALLTAILAGYHLYAMLPQISALLALALVALLAMALGWVHGPLLAALGVLAGAAAPFLLGKGASPSDALYVYFGAVAVLGLGIDGLKRWGWVSALALVAPMAGAVMVQMGGAGPLGLGLLAVALALLGSALPGGVLVPRAEGKQVTQGKGARPETRIAALAVVQGFLVLVLQVPAVQGVPLAGVLALALPLWTRRAPALSDLSVLAAATLPAAIATSMGTTPLMRSMVLNLYPWLPLAALGLGVLAALAMLQRSHEAQGRARDGWALLAVATPGATAIVAELFWAPATFLGPFQWAAAVMALAGFYTAVALWAARQDGGPMLRTGVAAAGAIGAMALALMLLLSLAALSVALAVLMVAAAALDRRLRLPELGAILGLGSMALAWRLLVDPGLGWLMTGTTSALDVWLTLAAVVGGPLAALVLTSDLPLDGRRERSRIWGRMIAETGLTGMVPAVVAIVMARFLDGALRGHAVLGVEGAVLIAAAWVQLRRARLMPGGRAMAVIRLTLAGLASLGALLCLGLGLTMLSPVFGGWMSDPVEGLPLLNDLVLAYGLPAAVLWLALRGNTSVWARVGKGLALLLGATWIGTMIRHLWHGGQGMLARSGVFEGELYAYTVALLIAGAGAMALALRFGDRGYRIGGLAVIGLAAVKAFVIDASGLEGLMRVGAFLALGLSLAGLAWVNGWVAARTGEPGPDKAAAPGAAP